MLREGNTFRKVGAGNEVEVGCVSVLVSLECVKKSLHAMKGSSTIAAEKTTRYNRDPINKLCLYFFRDKFGKSIRYGYQNSLLIIKYFQSPWFKLFLLKLTN